jgi:hypothetical protein
MLKPDILGRLVERVVLLFQKGFGG